ncbi:MAG TPA: septum formation family protein [Acidimicrobiales bacterium]|nr:septum formation family protein [Acidimicrobiales bacterium]
MSDPWQPGGGQPPPSAPPPPGSGGFPQQPGYPPQQPPPPGYPSPPGGFPPAPAGGPGWSPPGGGQGTDGFAIAALVLGILSCIPLGIIFGIIALNRIGRSGQKGRGLAIGGIVASVVWGALVVGAVALGGDDAERDDEGTITDAGSEDVFDLGTGDCINNPTEESELETVDAVPCTEPHDAEVFAEFDMSAAGDTYPGVPAAQQEAQTGCSEQFEGFVGMPFDGTALNLYYLYPTQDSWDRLDDRQITCLVSDPAGPTTGTLEGAAR